MSNIHEILATLSEAKQAVDAQPQLERRIHELSETLANRERHVGNLEATIHELREELAALNTKLAGVEAARDEAMFRELEAEDKAEKALSVVRRVLGEAREYVEAVTPAPEPVKEPEVQAQPQDHMKAAEYTDKLEAVAAAEAQPEKPGPSVDTAGDHPNVTVASSVENAHVEQGPAQPYAGKAYWDKPSDVSWTDWVAAGGDPAPWNR